MVTIPPQICKNCGTSFVRTYHFRIYCSEECSVAGIAAHNRYKAKQQYWADAEASRLRSNAYYQEHKVAMRESMRRSYTRTCETCGVQREQRGYPRDLPYLCRACQAERTRQAHRRPCQYCGVDVYPGAANGRLRLTCPDCFGQLTKVGVEIGLTRERVRQLVELERARAAAQGFPVSRRDALALVRVERLLKQTHEHPTFGLSAIAKSRGEQVQA